MFAKMMLGATDETRHVGVSYSVAEGERIEFTYNDEGRPLHEAVWKSGRAEEIPVRGDVYLLTDTGKTFSLFRPPLNFIGRNADGWKPMNAGPAAGRVT